MYKGKNSIILTARSMDWKEDIRTDLWIFSERNGTWWCYRRRFSEMDFKVWQCHSISIQHSYSWRNEWEGLFEYVGGKLVIHHDLSLSGNDKFSYIWAAACSELLLERDRGNSNASGNKPCIRQICKSFFLYTCSSDNRWYPSSNGSSIQYNQKLFSSLWYIYPRTT